MIKRFVALVLAVAFCLPLAGCDEFAEDAYTALKAADIAYNGIVEASAMACKQEFITKDKLARVTYYAEIYHSSWKSAVTVLEEYKAALDSGDTVKESVAGQSLEVALALMSRRLKELQTYWSETREAYANLKKDKV